MIPQIRLTTSMLDTYIKQIVCFLLLLNISSASLPPGHQAPVPIVIPRSSVSRIPHAFSKRTIHTAIAKGSPGTSDWRVRYIAVASAVPIDKAATMMIIIYERILRELSNIDLDTRLSDSIGQPFQIDIGGIFLNFQAKYGKLTSAFVFTVVEELLQSTRLGWVTQFRSEWMDMVSGFTVYITLAWGKSMEPSGITPGPIDRV